MSESRLPTQGTDPARVLLAASCFTTLAVLALFEQWQQIPGALVAFGAGYLIVRRGRPDDGA